MSGIQDTNDRRKAPGRRAAARQDAATRMLRLTGDEAACARIAQALEDALEPGRTALALFQQDGGAWAVEAYARDAMDERRLRAVVRAAAGAAAARALAFGEVVARDWVANSLAGLRPVAAGRFVVHGRHARAAVRGGRVGVEIEAALAFGTGRHGTTCGCLLAVDALLKRRRPRRILDLGTGSGVLAIAAAKALRSPVLATDIDAEAVRVARDNARVNRVGGLVRALCGAGANAPQLRERGRYDLVLANLLLDPLKRLAYPIVRLSAPHARLVLSGLLPAQARAIAAVHRGLGLRLERRIELDGWTTLVIVRGR